MPEFRYTTSGGKNPHTHMVYVLDDGTGVTSPHKDGSSHSIIREEAMLPPDMGMLLPGMPPQMAQPQEPIFRLSLAPDGHTHELTDLPEYSAPSKIESEDDSEKVSDVTTLYKDAKAVEKESREDGKESEEFLQGKQWPDDIKEKLEAEDRCALTINHVEPNHDTLTGIFRENRTDWKVLPVENGDSVIAEILTITMKQIASQSDYTQVETQVFDDVQDVGRGFFEIHADYDTDLQGQIRINYFPWDRAYCGPHEKLDGSDMEHLEKKEWFSEKKIRQLYPDKVEEIDKMLEVVRDGNRVLKEQPGATFSIDEMENLTDMDLSDLSRKNFAVIECERKVYRRVFVLIDVDNGFVFDGSKLSPKDLADAMKIKPNGKPFKKIQRNVHDMRVTATAGNTLLDDFMATDRPTNDFSLIPVYCKKKGNKFWGKIEAVKDPQRELNKRRSQNTDIMDRCVVDGWFSDQNTFPNKQEEADFEEKVGTPGFHVRIQDCKNPPVKTVANPYPTGVIQMEQMAGASIQKISGINLELQGMEASNTNSGVLFAAKQRQGMVGQKFLFDNFALAKKRLGKQIIAYIQDMYTADRIMRLIQNLAQVDPKTQIAGTDLGQFNMDELRARIQQALDNQELTKYDIEIAESPFSSSSRQSALLMLMEMARANPGSVPPDMIIDASDVPGKNKLLTRFAQYQEQANAKESAKNETEIKKTMIAANAKNGGAGEPAQPNMPKQIPLQQAP